jgi:hypothetical protein
MNPLERQLLELTEQRGPLTVTEILPTLRANDLSLFYPVEESEEFPLF